MKTGRTLTELAAEIQRQQAAKHDYLADTRELTMLNATELAMTGQDEPFTVNDHAHAQIASHVNIPRTYYDRLRVKYPQLLDRNVNELLRAEPAKRMVRTMDGTARAFLSDRYRRLDHTDLMEAILPTLGSMPGVEFPSCEVTDTHLYLKAVSSKLEAEVAKGDVIRCGILIKNSETGQGRLHVASFIVRLICKNGMVGEDIVSRYHAGRRIETDNEDEATELFADETLAADDKAFWLKVRDLVLAAFTEARFQQVIRQLKLTKETEPVADPSAGVKEMGRRFQLNENEQVSVLRYLTTGGDLSLYGMLNAVTRASQDVESYDRATELETVGGRLMLMGRGEWETVARATTTE